MAVVSHPPILCNPEKKCLRALHLEKRSSKPGQVQFLEYSSYTSSIGKSFYNYNSPIYLQREDRFLPNSSTLSAPFLQRSVIFLTLIDLQSKLLLCTECQSRCCCVWVGGEGVCQYSTFHSGNWYKLHTDKTRACQYKLWLHQESLPEQQTAKSFLAQTIHAIPQINVASDINSLQSHHTARRSRHH